MISSKTCSRLAAGSQQARSTKQTDIQAFRHSGTVDYLRTGGARHTRMKGTVGRHVIISAGTDGVGHGQDGVHTLAWTVWWLYASSAGRPFLHSFQNTSGALSHGKASITQRRCTLAVHVSVSWRARVFLSVGPRAGLRGGVARRPAR